jgi:hypothetical protein
MTFNERSALTLLAMFACLIYGMSRHEDTDSVCVELSSCEWRLLLKR